MRAHIDAPPRFRDSLQMSNGRGATRVVAKEDAHAALNTFTLYDEVVDVSLFFQNAGDFKFQLRSRNIYTRVFGRNGVADSRQQVGNRISHLLTPNQVSGSRRRDVLVDIR